MDVSGDDTDLALTVLTCEGDLRDPAFPNRLRQIICKLKRLVSDGMHSFRFHLQLSNSFLILSTI
jgi:hypothetical protein